MDGTGTGGAVLALLATTTHYVGFLVFLLFFTGTLVYADPWPDDRLHLAMRIGAFPLALLALLLFPRHETPEPLPITAEPVRS